MEDIEKLIKLMDGICPFCRGYISEINIERLDPSKYPTKKIICLDCKRATEGFKFRSAYIKFLTLK